MKENTVTDDLIRIGVVDDHISMISSFAKTLDELPGIKCVLEAYSGQEALQLLKGMSQLPHILLMDVDMDEMDGIQTTRVLTHEYPAIKVIAFTGLRDEITVRKMIAAGACAYVPKHVRTMNLQETVYKVHINKKYHADLFYLYGKGFGKIKVEAARVLFKPNEVRFIELLCLGLNFRDIGIQMGVTRNTVKYYKSCVVEKLKIPESSKNYLIVIVIEALRLGIVKL